MVDLNRSHPPSASLPAGQSSSWQGLRQQAEARLNSGVYPTVIAPPAGTGALPPEAHERLIHELHVHQLELEMQNDELRRIREELEISRARYFNLFDLAPVGYLTLDESGLIEEANLFAATLLDTPRTRLVGQPLARFLLSADRDRYYWCRKQLFATGERQSCELRLRTLDNTPDNAPRWIGLETGLQRNAATGQSLWQAILTDITEHKRHERDLLDIFRLRLVSEIADLTFWEWNPHTDEVAFPPEWQRQTQTDHDPARLPARLADWSMLLHPEDREATLVSLASFVDCPDTACEIQFRMRHRDNVYRWFAARLKAIQNAQGTIERVLLVQQDVTARREAEEQAIHAAQHDSLTGLPGRVLLDHLANHMLAAARRAKRQLAVLFFDLDRFKAINDAYGHLIGDQLLQAFARRLLDAFRAEDLVVRLGGDEFVVVLANIRDEEDAVRSVRKVIAALSPAYQIDEFELQCIPSIGISLFPRDGDNLECLIQRADLAMYHAKIVTPGQYQFVTEAVDLQMQRRCSLHEDQLSDDAAPAFLNKADQINFSPFG